MRSKIRLLIIGNYIFEHNVSMNYYGELLAREMAKKNFVVEYKTPIPIFGRIKPSKIGVGKWLGYIDRFIFFPVYLLIVSKNFDLCHVVDHCNSVYLPFIRSRKHVVTCHDTTGIKSISGDSFTYRPRFFGRVLQRLILRGLRFSKNIVCVSRNTFNELKTFVNFDDPSKHFFVVYPALRFPFSKDDSSDALVKNVNLKSLQPYVLHVGSNMWYKNRDSLIRIYHHLRNKKEYAQVKLVIAGAHLEPVQYDWLCSNGHKDMVIQFEAIQDDDLNKIYSYADCLIFPSLTEGFGSPIIEAQACSCPVATSDWAPMNEVAGNGAIFIESTVPNDAANTIAETLTKNKADIVSKGLLNVERYSLEAMVSNYIEIYSQILSTPS